MSLKQARPSGSGPLSTEEYIRRVFAEARRGRERDHTPRSVRPDGSMNTEDWLREVAFGTERPPKSEQPAASPLREPPRSEAPDASPSAPFGRGTILFPGKEAASAGPLLAETAGGARRDVGGSAAFPSTLMTAAASRAKHTPTPPLLPLSKDPLVYDALARKHPHARSMVYHEDALSAVQSVRKDISEAAQTAGVPPEAIAAAMLDENTKIRNRGFGVADDVQDLYCPPLTRSPC